MKNKLMTGFLLAVMAVLLAGCSIVILEKDDRKKTVQKNQIDRLEVYSMAENRSNIYHVKYPFYYYVFSHQGEDGKCSMWDFSNATKPDKLPIETTEYFIEYLNTLSENQSQEEGEVLAYEISYQYYDEEGNTVSGHLSGYDEFPEGFEEFITKLNEICGSNYLTGSGNQLQSWI